MLTAADLPSDIHSLKALLLMRDERIMGLEAQLNTRSTEIEQLELQLEDLQADEGEAAREMPAADQAPRKKSVRKPLQEHLPRDEKVYTPATDACRPAVVACVS